MKLNVNCLKNVAGQTVVGLLVISLVACAPQNKMKTRKSLGTATVFEKQVTDVALETVAANKTEQEALRSAEQTQKQKANAEAEAALDLLRDKESSTKTLNSLNAAERQEFRDIKALALKIKNIYLNQEESGEYKLKISVKDQQNGIIDVLSFSKDIAKSTDDKIEFVAQMGVEFGHNDRIHRTVGTGLKATLEIRDNNIKNLIITETTKEKSVSLGAIIRTNKAKVSLLNDYLSSSPVARLTEADAAVQVTQLYNPKHSANGEVIWIDAVEEYTVTPNRDEARLVRAEANRIQISIKGYDGKNILSINSIATKNETEKTQASFKSEDDYFRSILGLSSNSDYKKAVVLISSDNRAITSSLIDAAISLESTDGSKTSLNIQFALMTAEQEQLVAEAKKAAELEAETNKQKALEEASQKDKSQQESNHEKADFSNVKSNVVTTESATASAQSSNAAEKSTYERILDAFSGDFSKAWKLPGSDIKDM